MKRFSLPCTDLDVRLGRAVLPSKACHTHLLLSKLGGEDKSEAHRELPTASSNSNTGIRT
jgi:hypothetical protein